MIVFLAFPVIIIVAVWFFYINEVTNRERSKISDFIFSQQGDSWRDLLVEYSNIQYDEHLWHLVKFKSWKTLYPKAFVKKYEEWYELHNKQG